MLSNYLQLSVHIFVIRIIHVLVLNVPKSCACDNPLNGTICWMSCFPFASRRTTRWSWLQQRRIQGQFAMRVRCRRYGMRHHGAFMLSWDPGDRWPCWNLSQADMVTMQNRNSESQVNVRFKIFAQRFRVVLGKGNPTASMLKFPWGQASWNNRDFVLGMVTKNWRDLRPWQPWIHGRENMIRLAVFFV